MNREGSQTMVSNLGGANSLCQAVAAPCGGLLLHGAFPAGFDLRTLCGLTHIDSRTKRHRVASVTRQPGAARMRRAEKLTRSGSLFRLRRLRTSRNHNLVMRNELLCRAATGCRSNPLVVPPAALPLREVAWIEKGTPRIIMRSKYDPPEWPG